MNFSYINRLIELLPAENRLVYQAKSGDMDIFVQLYDAHVEHVYRYIHFLAPNDRVAESLTLQVFFKAWKNLNHYQVFGSSFVAWLYSIAQDQLNFYYRTHKKTVVDNDSLFTVRSGEFWEEFQAIRNGLQSLTAEQQQTLILKFIVGVPNKGIARIMTRREGEVRVLLMHALQVLAECSKETELKIKMKGFQRIFEECLARLLNGASGLTLDECLARYPEEYDAHLRPFLETALFLDIGRQVKPSPMFIAYTHDALMQYVQSHPRQPQIIMPVFQRTVLTFAILVGVFLATGTSVSQSALPGDTLYTWKRTSEQVWRALSLNPVATDIILAQRRLDEWVALANDPTRSASAMNSYLEILARLKSADDMETITLVVPALQTQQQTLNSVGLFVSELDDYLIEAESLVMVTPTQVFSTQIFSTITLAVSTFAIHTVTAVPTHIISTVIPTKVVPTVTVFSTVIVPTATEVPTIVVPTATEVPTIVVPTATEVPTIVVPTETEVPTIVVPTETEVPTIVVPTETEVPTEVPTDVPTDVPTVEVTPTVEGE